MDLPGTFLWVEADDPRMIEFKANRLSREVPRCKLERIAVDRSARQRLLAAVDARSKKRLVLTEGVVPYLRTEEAGSLADDLKAMKHSSDWIVERERLKRPPRVPLHLKAGMLFRMIFLSKDRRAQFKKLAGYAVMEPIR
jgi:O-methyltransferase involved in polyketide biosynthesis